LLFGFYSLLHYIGPFLYLFGFWLGGGQKVLLQVGHDISAKLREAADFITEQVDRLAGLLILSDLGVMLVGHAEIVPEDMPLLDVELEILKIGGGEAGERVDPEIPEALAGAGM